MKYSVSITVIGAGCTTFHYTLLAYETMACGKRAKSLDLVWAEPGDDVPLEEVRRQLGL